MDRLVFVVEGDSEVNFVKSHIIPYLYIRCKPECSISVQKVTTNRRKNTKGGVVSYALFFNEIRRVAAQKHVAVTTLFDFFRLPPDFPGYTKDAKRVGDIESAVKQDFVEKGILEDNSFFPYIQMHEFEALLFSNTSAWKELLSQNELKQIESIRSEFNNPEDINGGELTAPSKRLGRIFNYEKVTDSIIVMGRTEIDEIRSVCPRFNSWIQSLETFLLNSEQH